MFSIVKIKPIPALNPKKSFNITFNVGCNTFPRRLEIHVLHIYLCNRYLNQEKHKIKKIIFLPGGYEELID
jgi:hypothetical protein